MHTQENFQTFVDEQLNEQQRQAVTPSKGSLLVIAGAGSGKTRVITARITNLILTHGVDPSAIVALTFTNKAAKEMKERVAGFLDSFHIMPTVATFHSYCLQLLKQYKHLLPFEQFTIMDGQDQQKLIQKICKEHHLDKRVNAKQILYTISTYKRYDTLQADYDDQLFMDPQLFTQIYNAYEKEKRVSQCLDFDDLLVYVYKLFSTNKEFKAMFQRRVRHMLVDEYQDTNAIQNALLKAMTLDQQGKLAIDSICAVGDEDQSIYSWRGATVENILHFNKDFPDTQLIKIEQNYRSTQYILDVANHVIINNTARNHKKLWSEKQGRHKALQLECLSDYQEANLIALLCKLLQRTTKLKKCAILYRTHYQSRIIEEGLIKSSIPYKIIGGIQFYERKEIKDIIAYLKLLVNPFDRVSFTRVINCPTRGLGAKFEEQFFALWNEQPLFTFIDVANKLINDKLIPPAKQKTLQAFINLFEKLADNVSAHNAVRHFIDQIEYIAYIKNSFDPQDAQTKCENVQEFMRALQHFEEQGIVEPQSVLDEIALMQEKIDKRDANSDYVQLMTLHGAKGLEFENVVLVGVEDGILPSTQSLYNDASIEEERRLLYVGLTRAEQRLIIMHSKTRMSYGQTTIQSPSRFLDEIPAQLRIIQPSMHWSQSQFITFFKQWLTGATPTITNHVKTFNTKDFPPPKHLAKKTKTLKKPSKADEWKKMQSVKHPTFGTGIAYKAEQKGSNKVIVTVHFTNHGVKKIDASFLEIV